MTEQQDDEHDDADEDSREQEEQGQGGGEGDRLPLLADEGTARADRRAKRARER